MAQQQDMQKLTTKIDSLKGKIERQQNINDTSAKRMTLMSDRLQVLTNAVREREGMSDAVHTSLQRNSESVTQINEKLMTFTARINQRLDDIERQLRRFPPPPPPPYNRGGGRYHRRQTIRLRKARLRKTKRLRKRK